MTPTVLAQVSRALVGAATHTGRAVRRRVDGWRQDRRWTHDLTDAHAQHYAAAQPAIERVLADMADGLAFGPDAWRAARDADARNEAGSQ